MKKKNLIVGKKNSGKTQGILFNEVKKAILNNENLCIYDLKEEYYRTFSNELRKNNYNVMVVNLSSPEKSNGFNPLLAPYLLYKQGQIDKAITMVNDLALEIFKEEGSFDPFWENMASNYFIGLTSILFKEASLEQVNLGSIQVMMCQGEEKYESTTYLKKYMENVDVTSTIYSTLSPIVFAPNETKGSILSVAKQKLNAYIFREQLFNMLNTNEINLCQLNGKCAIFIIGKEGSNDIANIFIDQLSQFKNIEFTYILDNLDNLRKIIELELLANSELNKLYVSVRNIDKFKDKYGKYILDNFDSVIDLDNNKVEFEFISIGSDNDYPTLLMNKHNYLNFKELVENI